VEDCPAPPGSYGSRAGDGWIAFCTMMATASETITMADLDVPFLRKGCRFSGDQHSDRRACRAPATCASQKLAPAST